MTTPTLAPWVFPADPHAAAALEKLIGDSEPQTLEKILRAAHEKQKPKQIISYSYSIKTITSYFNEKLDELIITISDKNDNSEIISHLLSTNKTKNIWTLEIPNIATIHSKIYIIKIDKNQDLCIVGSSNFTLNGIQNNIECNICISSLSYNDDKKINPFLFFNSIKNLSKPISEYSKTHIIQKIKNINLFEYQREAIEEMNKTLLPHINKKDYHTVHENAQNPYGAMISLPTGAGKTLMLLSWIWESLILEKEISSDIRILWIADNDELLTQAISSLYAIATTSQLSKVQPIHIKSEYKDWWKIANHFNFIFSTRKLTRNRLNEKGTHKKPFDLIVIDEAHHVSFETIEYKSILQKIKHKLLIGLSATPYRHLDSKNQLKDIFSITKNDSWPFVNRTMNQLSQIKQNNKKIFATLISHPISLPNPIDAKNAKTEKDLSLVNFYNYPSRIKTIVNAYNKDHHGLTLIFAVDIKDANKITNELILKHNQIKVQALHTGDNVAGNYRSTNNKITSGERNQLIDAFKSGEINVLVSVEMVLEGIDIPSIETIFLARPTSSLRLFAQMVGRGLRGEGVIDKKTGVRGTSRCNIVEFEHTFNNLKNLKIISTSDLFKEWELTPTHSKSKLLHFKQIILNNLHKKSPNITPKNQTNGFKFFITKQNKKYEICSIFESQNHIYIKTPWSVHSMLLDRGALSLFYSHLRSSGMLS